MFFRKKEMQPPPPPPPTKNWKYIGETADAFPVKDAEYKATVRAVYYMTDDGERRFEIVPSRYRDGLDQIGAALYLDAYIWQRGGPFPRDFKEQIDTLGPMLERLVNKRITGEE